MLVMPDAIRPDPLLIHEKAERLHVRDLRHPAQRQRQQRPHAILDHQARVHPLRQLRKHAEIERRRGDLGEIARIGKEVPGALQRGWDDLGGLQDVQGHRRVMVQKADRRLRRRPCRPSVHRAGRRRARARFGLSPGSRRSNVPATWRWTPRIELEAEIELLRRIGQGDRQSFRRASTTALPGCSFTIIHRVLSSPEASEDVLQEVFVLIWEKAPLYSPSRGKPLTWAVMLARHKAIDRLRSLQRRERLHEEAHRQSATLENLRRARLLFRRDRRRKPGARARGPRQTHRPSSANRWSSRFSKG